MERLIMEYSVGDGYTYSCTNTIPILHSSKEDAISELETLILTMMEKQAKIHKEIAKLQDEQRIALEKLQKQKQSDRLVVTDSGINKEFLSYHEKINSLWKEINDQFVFGGQTLYYSNFIADGQKGEIQMPEFYTLDEFYANIEK